MFQQLRLVCDNSTLANFKSWAQSISSWFTTCGWVQGTDTGQVNWSTIGSVPGSGAFVYEIWKPGDGLQNFYVKIEYGNTPQGGTNSPSVRITLGTGTNGAGTLTGFVTTANATAYGTYTAPSATTPYECDFTGDSGRIGVMLWRDGANSCQQCFVIERSLNSSGVYYGTSTTGYVTAICIGPPSSLNNAWVTAAQQSLLFGVGIGPTTDKVNPHNMNYTPTLAVRFSLFPGASSTVCNGSIPFDTVAPAVGVFDYPMTMLGIACGSDITEGIPFAATLYGTSHNYMPSKNGYFPLSLIIDGANVAVCMRYD
jgi:hypothetical protein